MIIFDLFYLFFCVDPLKDYECVNQDMKILISNLELRNIINNPVVAKVMCSIDRKDFTNKHPYVDT
jgi:hypothetical protein